jgi:hypothetical protein
MSGLSGSGETLLLNTLMTGRFVSLHTNDPGNTGAGEVTGTPYARQSSTWAATGNNPTIIANTAVIQFPTATSDWGTISYFGVWSAATAGTFYGGWPVTTPKTVSTEDTARWDVGKLRIATDEPIP